MRLMRFMGSRVYEACRVQFFLVYGLQVVGFRV